MLTGALDGDSLDEARLGLAVLASAWTDDGVLAPGDARCDDELWFDSQRPFVCSCDGVKDFFGVFIRYADDGRSSGDAVVLL